jgi:hypothetical protein
LAFGHKDVESVEKPIGWRIIEGLWLAEPLDAYIEGGHTT